MTFYRNSNWKRYPSNAQSKNPLPPGVNVQVSDPTLATRIDILLAKPAVQSDQWTREFCTSLKAQFANKGSLSQKQVDALARQEMKFDPSLSVAANADFEKWKEEFDENKKENLVKIAKWYKTQHEQSPLNADGITHQVPYYYQNTAEKVLSDPDFIPTREAYEKMVNNKFAVRHIKNTMYGSRFDSGDIVQLSAVATKRYAHQFPCETGLVIHVAEPKKNIAGGYVVTVLPTGTDVMVDIEERWLKKAKGT